MIKINLLGAPKPKRGKRASASMPVMAGEGPNPVVMMVVAGVLGLAVAGFLYWRADSEQQRLNAEIVKEEAENRRLAAVKAKYEQEEKVKQNYERRVKVIDELRANQSGPVNLLAMIGDTVNSTEAVWLNTMTDTGSSITLDGTALSSHAVANLIKNLQKTEFFRTVELNENIQDPQVKNMEAFNFKLICEKKTTPAAPAAPAGAAPAAPAAGQRG
ncbi:MAG: PilN domain-containing protein [Acidobacteriales bacterium]|nr:PilN domain-containing protein [Terriglobales bacterium]